jgi:predicted Fe-Mo cluster-binding NifX family protein
MKVAIPHWQGRVSPVFDVATQLLIAEIEDGEVVERYTLGLNASDLHARARQVAELGVDVLICGAISWPLELALANTGVDVVPQTCGQVEDILATFLAGRLGQNAFLMPGCCGRRRRFRGSRRGRPA